MGERDKMDGTGEIRGKEWDRPGEGKMRMGRRIKP